MKEQRKHRVVPLGELELQALDLLSRIGEGSVYAVQDAFPEDARPKYTSVATVLNSLEKKGLVSHTTRDRAYIYRPTESADEVRGRFVGDVLERVFAGSMRDLVVAALKAGEVTPEVLEELKSVLADWEVEDDASS